ncbi:MAG: NADH-quinone oxidoreductase subunit J [bacterium]
MASFLFFLFASIAIAAAVMVIWHRNAVYSALFLIVTLFALAGLYVLLQAPFIAAVHIIIYAGAIMVLFLFVIMLLDLQKDVRQKSSNKITRVAGLALAGILIVELAWFIKSGSTESMPLPKEALVVGNTESVGMLLFTQYLFPFEIASVLLLSAIIGSVILAKLNLKT